MGIVNRSFVSPINPEPTDGEVSVLVPYRDLDGVSAWMAGTTGEIVGREPHDFLQDGVMMPGEWLRIRFWDFLSGNLRLNRLGLNSSRPALALGYNLFEADVVEVRSARSTS